jgi:hypothetical protein
MRQQYRKVMILSGELASNSHEKNRQLTANLESDLADLNVVFNKAIGCYKGQTENSFVVLPRDNDEIDAVMYLVFKLYKQESVLMQDDQGICSLYYANGQSEKLGTFRMVQYTNNLENYTILNGLIYTI